MVLLSPDEKMYIVHGIEENIRTDGRERLQYRPMDLETGLMPNCMGSARLVLGNTDIIACVNADTFTPPSEKPSEGKLEFYIHFSGVASPDHEGRKGEQKSEQISTIFNKLYSGTRLDFLCIEPKVKCWKINIDVSVLSIGGNLYDAVSLAAKSALATTNIPKLIQTSEDKGIHEFKISDDPWDTWIPDVSNFPCLVTLSKVGESLLVDLTTTEEQCATYSQVTAVTPFGKILGTVKIGPGSLLPSTLSSVMTGAVQAGLILIKELNTVLSTENKIKHRETIGFLT